MNYTGATMEEYHRHCNEADLNANESHNIVQGGVLGGEYYNQNINQWTAKIVECLVHLVTLVKAYKSIMTCAVV